MFFVPKFLNFCFSNVNFSCKDWKSRESLQNRPKNEFLALNKCRFFVKNCQFFKIGVWKLFKNHPKFLNFGLRNVTFSSENCKGISLKNRQKMNFSLCNNVYFSWKIWNFSKLGPENCSKIAKISEFWPW